MMKLDKRGDVSIAEIVIYIPILIVSFILVLRHGFTRRAGWIFLLILSIIRIVGGVTHVLSEQKPTNITLIIIYSIMEGAGVSPLLLATLGFLQTVGQNSLDNHPLMSGGTRLMGLVGVVALALTIAGGVTAGNATTESSLNSGTKLRHIGVILFAIVYGFILVVHIFCWSNKNQILRYRRTLLAGISFALPFLGVRVAYAVLSAFAPVTRSINSNGQVTYTTSTSALSKFSSTSGSWVLYLIMSVVAEYIVVLIYTTVGIKIPLENDTDYSRGMNTDAWEDEEMARFKPLTLHSQH